MITSGMRILLKSLSRDLTVKSHVNVPTKKWTVGKIATHVSMFTLEIACEQRILSLLLECHM